MQLISDLPANLVVSRAGVTFRCSCCELTAAQLFLNAKSPELGRGLALANNTMRKGIDSGNRSALVEDLMNVLDWLDANNVSTPQTWSAIAFIVRQVFA